MSDTPSRSPSRRIVLFFAAFAPLGLYLLGTMIAAAIVLGPRIQETMESRRAAMQEHRFELVSSTPVDAGEWATLGRLMPEGVREVGLSPDGLRMRYASDLRQNIHADAWNRVAEEMVKLGPNRFTFVNEPYTVPQPPSLTPTSAEAGQLIPLSLLLTLPAVGLLCWAFRRRLDARTEFSARQAIKWCLLALVGIYSVNMSLSLIAPPDELEMGRYLDTYRPLYAELGPWFTAALMIGLAPLAEELVFRKWMLSLLPRSIGSVAAVLLGSALFVAVHQPGSVWHASILTAPSLAFALLWMRSRSLLLCWSTHAAMNTIGFFAMWALM